jgi:hypothetical protein
MSNPKGNKMSVKNLVIALVVTVAAFLVPVSVNGQWSQNGNDVSKNPTAGNVGIGTTATPNSTLTVVGNVGVEANVSYNSGIGLLGLDSSNAYLQLYDSTRTLKTYLSSRSGVNNYVNNGGNLAIGTNSADTARLSIVGNTGNAGNNGMAIGIPGLNWGLIHFGWGTTYDDYIRSGSGGKVILQDTGGNVGIGTATPADKLHVSSGVRISPFTPNAAGGYLNTSAVLSLMNGNIYQTGGSEVSTIRFGGMYNPSGTQIDAAYNYIDWSAGWFRIRNNQQTKIQLGAGDEWGRQDVYINPNGGNLGVGTAAPGNSTKFQVAGNGLFTGGSYDPGDGTPSGVNIGYYSPGGFGYLQAVQTGVTTRKLVLQPINDTASYVGIGVTNPTVKLDVQGDIRASGTINAKYQDVAEWVPSLNNSLRALS